MQLTAFIAHNSQRLALIAFFFVLSFFTFHFVFTSTVHAQVCDSTQTNFSYGGVIDEVNKCAIKKDIFDDKIFNYNQLVGTADSLNVLITGRSLNHPETDNITADASALAGISNGIALAYAAPPASGVEYFAHKFRDLNPVQPAYAQAGGIGFSALQPVEQVWSAFRNAAYVIFVIIFVIIGFMIMFRAHVSPQAVATVQDSIPRLVIALILVTFSYAIAGFLIDLMYIVINVAISILATAGLDAAGNAQNVFKDNIFQLILKGWPAMVKVTSDVISTTLKSLFDGLLGGTGCSITDPGGCAGKMVAWALGWVGGIILGIALLFAMVRIFFMLLMSYIMIIVLTIFAPFFFLIQALPGRNGAMEWFKQIGSNIAVFPTVVIMFLLAAVLGGIGAWGGSAPAIATTNFADAFRPPLLTGGFTAETLSKLIAIGLVLMTPEAAKLVKEFIGAKGPQMGGAMMAAPAAAAGFLGRRATDSAPARAFKDIGEERGRRNATGIISRVPGWMGGPTAGTTAPDIARRKNA